jgi:hypothetical protein
MPLTDGLLPNNFQRKGTGNSYILAGHAFTIHATKTNCVVTRQFGLASKIEQENLSRRMLRKATSIVGVK